MGGKDVTEIIIEAAPAIGSVANLLVDMMGWLSVLALAEETHPRSPVKDNEVTFQDLDTLTRTKGVQHFLEQFIYVYNGEDSVPPQKSGDKILANEDYFNVQANNTSAVGSAVAASLKNTTAPWATAQMINDVTARVLTLINGAPTKAFVQKAFTLQYANDDKSKVYQTDLCWTYCVTDAPDPNNKISTVKTLFLYSIGTAYLTEPWGKRIKVGDIPVVRIAFAYATAVIGTAIAAYLYDAKSKNADVYATVSLMPPSATITITHKKSGDKDLQSGPESIAYQWALDALKQAGVSKTQVDFGVATATEAKEFNYLKTWETGV